MTRKPDYQTNESYDIRRDNSPYLLVVISYCCRDTNKRDDTGQAREERDSPQHRPQRSKYQEHAQQPEEHRTMTHQDSEVCLAERHAVERCESVAAEHTRKGQ